MDMQSVADQYGLFATWLCDTQALEITHIEIASEGVSFKMCRFASQGQSNCICFTLRMIIILRGSRCDFLECFSMEFLVQALKALPTIAVHPLAFAGYALVLGSWLIALLRTKRFKLLLDRIKDIPEQDRKYLIEREMDTILPTSITAEEWIQLRRQRYYFAAYIISIIAAVTIVGFAVNHGASLVIDDVKLQKDGINIQLISSAFADEILSQERAKLGFKEENNRSYKFDITLRNPSDQPVNVTDIRVIFDPGTGGGLLSVQEISGTYFVKINPDGSAETTGGGGRFSAYAWYPHGSGTLYVKSPLAQTLKPHDTDRFVVIVEFPRDYKYRGDMKTAKLQLMWNGDEYVYSKLVDLKP